MSGGYSLVAVPSHWGVLFCCGALALGNGLSICSTWDPPRPGVKPVSPRLDLKWISNKEQLYGAWNSAQCYVAAWMGGAFGGGENGCRFMYDCSPETITALLIGYTPIRNKVF